MIRKLVYLFAILSFITFGLGLNVAVSEEAKETTLPAGGGDPGKAYMEYCKAITSGNMDALKKLVSAERAKQMEAPEFKEMFGMIQAMMAKDIKVTGGTMKGNTATLNAEGKDSMGEGMATGTISMVLENKEWKVEKDSWKSGTK